MPGDVSEAPNFQAPYALCLLVCDSVITDAETGKPTIVGCFTSIGALKFPVIHSGMTVFAEMTDGRGDVPLRLVLTDVDEDKVLFSAEFKVPMVDPLMVGRVVMRVPPVSFPIPGEYRLQLAAGPEPLLERRILLIKIESGDDETVESGDGGAAE